MAINKIISAVVVTVVVAVAVKEDVKMRVEANDMLLQAEYDLHDVQDSINNAIKLGKPYHEYAPLISTRKDLRQAIVDLNNMISK